MTPLDRVRTPATRTSLGAWKPEDIFPSIPCGAGGAPKTPFPCEAFTNHTANPKFYSKSYFCCLVCWGFQRVFLALIILPEVHFPDVYARVKRAMATLDAMKEDLDVASWPMAYVCGRLVFCTSLHFAYQKIGSIFAVQRFYAACMSLCELTQ